MNEVKTLIEYDKRPMSENESMTLMKLLMIPDIPKKKFLPYLSLSSLIVDYHQILM